MTDQQPPQTDQAAPPQRLLKLLPFQLDDSQPLDEARQLLVEQLHFTQQLFPGEPRKLVLTVAGHIPGAPLAEATVDWILEVVVGELGRYVTELDLPFGHFHKPSQRDDVPELAAAE